MTGTGSAMAVPDQALVRVSAVHRAPTMAEALAGVESARAVVVAVADDLVVSSTDLSVWPVTDQRGKPDGFEARHALTVAAEDLSSAGDLLVLLADRGGQRLMIDGVQLTVRDQSAALATARDAAFADARSRAEQLAGLAEETLGDVQSVVEGGSSWPVPQPMFAAQKADVSLQPGETTVSASLTVTWSLAD